MEREEFSTCFKVLENTIEKKEQYLEELWKLTKEQERVLMAEKFSMEEFSALMEKKEPYIGKISEFDAGFENVFAKMKPVMEEYKKEIEEMREKGKNVLLEIFPSIGCYGGAWTSGRITREDLATAH